jgi:cell wall assembly regulator SMI1
MKMIDIAKEQWNPYWLPLAHDGSGGHLCVDVALAY